MNTTRKIAIGLGLAGGALLAAYLLTGDRKKKTKDFLAKQAQGIKETLKSKVDAPEDRDVHYV
jgi:hypothetical protein